MKIEFLDTNQIFLWHVTYSNVKKKKTNKRGNEEELYRTRLTQTYTTKK